jgi:hypothetical protein
MLDTVLNGALISLVLWTIVLVAGTRLGMSQEIKTMTVTVDAAVKVILAILFGGLLLGMMWVSDRTRETAQNLTLLVITLSMFPALGAGWEWVVKPLWNRAMVDLDKSMAKGACYMVALAGLVFILCGGFLLPVLLIRSCLEMLGML